MKYLRVCLPQLIKEYDFWMKGSENINETNKKINHIVQNARWRTTEPILG